MNGDVRWYLTENMIWNIEPLKNGHLLLSTERLVNAPYYNTGLYEIDLLGKIYMEYSLEGGYHHDYEELLNGNLLVASNQFHNEKGTVEDVIVEIDRKTVKILKQIDLKDILKMEKVRIGQNMIGFIIILFGMMKKQILLHFQEDIKMQSLILIMIL